MSLSSLLVQSATVERYTDTGNRDRNNNPEVEWIAVGTYACRLELTDPEELTVGRDTVISNMRVFLEPSAAGQVEALDRVTVEDVTYEVVGPPITHNVPRSGAAVVHHVEARLKHAA